VEAVTVDAVTRSSKVAKTTLYRHFDGTTGLLAAAFERLLPPVTPSPVAGTLRDGLIELLTRQATLLHEAPIQLTLLAWVSRGPTGGSAEESRDSLRLRVIEQYCKPFDDLLDTRQARDELGEFERTLGLAQLLGPLLFGVITGIRPLERGDCIRIVDDFLVSHGR